MVELKRVNGRPVVDYTARDYDSILAAMRALVPTKLPEWTGYESPADFGNVLLQLFAHMGDVLAYYQDRVANESFLGTAQTRQSVIHHLRLIGYRLATAAPASATLELSLPATFKDSIVIRQGDAFATKSLADRPSVRFEYTRPEPLTIDFSAQKHYLGVPVEEGRLFRDETLGVSDGSRNQRYTLPHAGLILRSLGAGQAIHKDIVVLTRPAERPQDERPQEWTLRESLAFSRESQRDFVIEIDADDRATILFGDGAFGAIPPAGASITATYRVGGGLHGNVPPESIETIIDAPQLALLAAKVTNPSAATGGADRESIDHAVSHAPAVFRSLKRAVTAEDYEALALDFRGVGKVRAEATGWNRVTLYIAPTGGGHVNDLLVSNLLGYFEDKRPVSTTIEIEDVEYVKIFVTAEVKAKSYYSPENVYELVRDAASRLLAFDTVDFGEVLYLSKFYEAIEAIEGVEYVNLSEFRWEGATELIDPRGRIALDPDEIPRVPNDRNDDPAYAGGLRVIPAREAG